MADDYITTQGDTWDAIAYKCFGCETFLNHLVMANLEHLDVLIFPAGVVLVVPDITIPTTTMELPPWMKA
ncbi:tail protein X [Desulfosarcina sp. OttesenSCG-928-A07]|nr:tail protein X [Desulfosarcina sp. OttesenSCG-928-G17]MDL2329092.1 tail protein X [Desulfosarcina sp. OttesenSCG-928-A07]